MHRFVRTMSAASLLLAASAAAAAAQDVSVPVTYEDFLYSGTLPGTYGGYPGVGHPDFECCLTGLIQNMVGNTLVGGVPAWGPMAPFASLHGVTSFSQWFQDTPGTNVTLPGSLTLSNIGGNTYQYANSFFFPIDGQGFNSGGFQNGLGTDLNEHNFAFTMHMQFSGDITDPNQQLSVASEGDLWVFADGHLAIDLGGVHGPATGIIDGATLLADAGASLGEDVTFDVFFAQRHTAASQFALTTDIVPDVPEPGSAGLVGLALCAIAALRRRRYAPVSTGSIARGSPSRYT